MVARVLKRAWTPRAFAIAAAVWLFTTLACYAPYYGRWRATWDHHSANVVLYCVGFALTLLAAPLVGASARLPGLVRVALAFVLAQSLAFAGAQIGRPLVGLVGLEHIAHGLQLATMMSVLLWPIAAGFAFLEIDRQVSRLNERERRLATVEAALGHAQSTVGRLQMNPHFLFNTLYSISSLIVVSRNDDAEAMTSRLSDFMRASLLKADAVVSLDEELETLHAYLDLERIRFGPRLDVVLDVDDALLDAAVPSFVLQPLVENAVKYAVQRSRAPVQIRITCRADGPAMTLTVENDAPVGCSGPPIRDGAGTALANIRSRLHEGFGPAARFEAAATASGGWRAALRLPIRDAAPLAQAS